MSAEICAKDGEAAFAWCSSSSSSEVGSGEDGLRKMMRPSWSLLGPTTRASVMDGCERMTVSMGPGEAFSPLFYRCQS